MLITIGFITGIIEDKVQNVIANKQLDERTKQHIIKELNHIKSKLTNTEIDEDSLFALRVRTNTDKINYYQFLKSYNFVNDNLLELCDKDDNKIYISLFNVYEFKILENNGTPVYPYYEDEREDVN